MNIIYRCNRIKKYFKIYNLVIKLNTYYQILLLNLKILKHIKKSKYKDFSKEESKRTKIN